MRRVFRGVGRPAVATDGQHRVSRQPPARIGRLGGEHDVPQRWSGELGERLGPGGPVDEFEVAYRREHPDHGGCRWPAGRRPTQVRRAARRTVVVRRDVVNPGVAVVEVEQDLLVGIQRQVVGVQHPEGMQHTDLRQHLGGPGPRDLGAQGAEGCVLGEHPIQGASLDQQLAGRGEATVAVRQQQLVEPAQVGRGLLARVPGQRQHRVRQGGEIIGIVLRIGVQDRLAYRRIP